MKTYREMSDRVLERGHAMIAEKNRKRRVMKKWTAVTVPCLLVLVVAGTLWDEGTFKDLDADAPIGDIQSNNPGGKDNEDADRNDPSIEGDEIQVLPPDNNHGTMDDNNHGTVDDNNHGTVDDPQPDVDIDNALTKWGGKIITSSLLYKLESIQHEYEMLEITINLSINDKFAYNGKTISDYRIERELEDYYPERLLMLQKMGHELKYGERIYTTGIPDGTKWSKSFYDNVVNDLGYDLIQTYIKDGEFLEEQLIADYDSFMAGEKPADKVYREACNAYLTGTLSDISHELTKQGIANSLAGNQLYLIMNVSLEQFKKLEIGELEYCTFGTASVDDDHVDLDDSTTSDDAMSPSQDIS